MGDRVYLQRPPCYALAPEERERIAHQFKLLSKSTDPLQLSAVRDEVITADKNCVHHSSRSIASRSYSHEILRIAIGGAVAHGSGTSSQRRSSSTEAARPLRTDNMPQVLGAVASTSFHPCNMGTAGNLPETIRERYDRKLANVPSNSSTREEPAQEVK